MTYEKTIKLYGKDSPCEVHYVNHYGSDAMAVNAARVSFAQDDMDKELTEKDEKLINYLIKHKHSSPFEHSGLTFSFTVPLYVRSQHHRHRTWQFNEVSARYCDTDLGFYEPDSFRTQHKNNRQSSNAKDLINPFLSVTAGVAGMHKVTTASDKIREHHGRCRELYDELIGIGVCREQARGVLPQNSLTRFYGTVNLMNLIKFIDLRTHEGAQWEIQMVAEACRVIATDLFPLTMNAYNHGKDSGSQ
tara:strand:+ start:64 stop:804 length:741 start_codon:yes stop_codon:yes gene_type:complete